MYTLPRTNYLKRDLLAAYQRPVSQRYAISPGERIKQQLRSLGASRVAIHSLEGKYLQHIIHPDEYILGVVYGESEAGLAMLIATDRRAIYLDKKPFFANEDEITYDVVCGVTHGHVGLGSTITLHTRIKDYTIKTFNEKSAKNFVEAIEARCVEHNREEGRHDYYTQNRSL